MIKKQRLISLTRKVIRMNSENPPGNEWILSEFIRKEMQSLGLHVRTYSYQKRRPNVIITLKGIWPREKASREAILVTPHFDTVPAGKGWSFPAFGAKIHRGRIYGRGATDDKGNLACCMEVMRSLVEDHVRLKRDIILAATADEETGSKYGIIPLLSHGVLKPRWALILDSDEFDTIIAQKGLIHLRVQIFGKKSHGAYNWRGVNAIEQSARIIKKLKEIKFPCRRHPLLRLPTMNVGTIRGGDKVNIVADFCEFSLDIRFLPEMKVSVVLGKIKTVIRRVTTRFKIEIDNIQEPYEIDSRHPFIESWMRVCRRLGVCAHLKGSEGATVITFFKKRGIPAFATGFGSHGTAHINDEYVKVKDLYLGSQVLERFLIEAGNR